jgi:hypothetical protein
MKLSATFPMLFEFEDYHEIIFFANNLQDVFGKKIKGAEVGMYKDKYVGLFYVGKLPSKAVQTELVRRYFSFDNKEQAAKFVKERSFPFEDEEEIGSIPCPHKNCPIANCGNYK